MLDSSRGCIQFSDIFLWAWVGLGEIHALCFQSMDVGRAAGYVGQYVSPLGGADIDIEVTCAANHFL